MKNCTCDKLNCDASCLCACHREETFPEEVETHLESLAEQRFRIWLKSN